MKEFLENKKLLFIFELANNHNGSKKNAFKLIDDAKKISKYKNINFGFKLQFRNLKSFLHKNSKKVANKHVKRFIDTKLEDKDYLEICKYIKKKGFKLVITPFDEKSVELAKKGKVDIIKIASCSNNDWPLIEKIAEQKKPVIASTGGINFDEIDNLSHFFANKKLKLSILHCVSIYPTKDNNSFNLNVIKKMIKRYPQNIIGYSGHEEETNFLPSICAAAAGGQIIERHFSNLEKKNDYSISSDKLDSLLKQIDDALDLMGKFEKNLSKKEVESIQDLQRGVFARKKILKNSKNLKNKIYLAFPKMHKDQLSPKDLSSDIKIINNHKKDDYVLGKKEINKISLIRKYVHRYKFMLNEAGVVTGDDCSAELSHHYGIDKIEKFGAFLITVVNSTYCKKLVCLFENQYHPKHKHFKKIETFHILSGVLKLKKENTVYKLYPGEKINVLNNEWHEFTTETGCIFEEVSTESLKRDSVYFDKKIQNVDLLFRKTPVNLT